MLLLKIFLNTSSPAEHVCILVIHLCPTLSDPMDCSLPGFSALGILQARILEWVAIPFSRGSSRPRDWTQVSCIAGIFFTIWAIREVLAEPVAHSYYSSVWQTPLFWGQIWFEEIILFIYKMNKMSNNFWYNKVIPL